MSVATRQITGRRKLHFNSWEEMLAEVDRLAASPVRCLGNWSLGQNCAHLATAFNQSIDGAKYKASWIVRTVAPWLKKRYLTRAMSPGFKIPGYAVKAMIPSVEDDAAGVMELRAAIARQQRESSRVPSPVFGPMTREEWNQLHFRHAEMHLSFIEPA